jgi:hypothetical protein
MSTNPEPLCLSLAAGNLRVEFYWHDDRFRHEFVLPDGVRIGSVEGNASQSWPPSPPIQQLSKESIGPSQALLGVGAAGQGHWSLSVDPVNADPQVLRFDVACRLKASPEFLGSTIQPTHRLRIMPAADSKVLTKEDGTIVIEPAKVEAGETIRWGYQVAVASS